PRGFLGGATWSAASGPSRPSSSVSVRPSTTAATVPVATAASLHSEVCTLLAAGGGLPGALVCACATIAALKAAASTPTRNPLPMANETPPRTTPHHATAPVRRG